MPQTQDKTSNSTSSNQGTSSTQSSYAPQVADLNRAFTDAMGAYGASSSARAPTDFTASFSPEQLQAYQNMVGFSGDTTVANGQASAASALTNAGVGGTNGSLTGLAGFNPYASNNPDALVAAANKFVGGQDIDSQVRLAMQGGMEQARDVTLPGIEQNAAMTGNTNSSRTGIADGLVQRGLAEQAANLGGSLRSQAFQHGLTLAQQQAAGNNTSQLSALTGEGVIGNAAANAGNAAGNSSIANLIQQLSAGAAGGAGLTAAQQAQLTNALQKYQSGVTAPFAPLSTLLGTIGGNYGQTTNASSTGTGTGTDHTETNASPWQIGAGILGAGASTFGSGGLNLLAPLGAGILKGFQ